MEKNDELMDEMERALAALQKPRVTQIIVLRIVIGSVMAIVNLPSTIRFMYQESKRLKEAKAQTEDDSDDGRQNFVPLTNNGTQQAVF